MRPSESIPSIMEGFVYRALIGIHSMPPCIGGLAPKIRRGQHAPLGLKPLLLGWSNPDGLDVDELPDAIGGELSAVARAFDPVKRQAWIRGHHAIDEDLTGLDVAGQTA